MKKILACLLVLIAWSPEATCQPLQDSCTTDDGVKLYVSKSGKGPLCIFVHGGPGAWSKSFEALKGSSLEKELCMVYYDQRGCGRSGNSESGDYSLERMVNDIEVIRKRYGNDKVYLLSHSFGGILALSYALKYPEHVKGLILVNATLDIRSSLESQICYINSLLKTNFATADRSPASVLATFMEARTALSEKDLTYKVLSDSRQSVITLDSIDASSKRSYDFAQKAFTIDDYWKDYTGLTGHAKAPVLAITGTSDHSVGENHYLSFSFTNGQIEKIAGGHMLYYENNSAFTKAIFKFVRKTSR